MSDWSSVPIEGSLEWEFIAKQAVATTVAEVVFSGIDTAYRRFRLEGYVVNATLGSPANTSVALNDDVSEGTDNYLGYVTEYEEEGEIDFSEFASDDFTLVSVAYAAGIIGAVWMFIAKPAASIAAEIVSYAVAQNTNTAGGSPGVEVRDQRGKWQNTDELIDTITILGSNIGAGSRFTLSGARESL